MTDHDVVIVGGGPTGAAAAIFTARYGLETVVFDRGKAALSRCAVLENYPGFPGGIDIETFYELLHEHVTVAGGEVLDDLVTDVQQKEQRFVVTTQSSRSVTTDSIIAATWYDGAYLEPIGPPELFEHHTHDGETRTYIDPDYPTPDGHTGIDGLYIASPIEGRTYQAITAAGQGAHVARTLIADHRREEGYPQGATEQYDWRRRDGEFAGEWATRERWREWYDNETADDHDLDLDRYEALRSAYIDDAFETRVPSEAIEPTVTDGRRRLIDTIGAEKVLECIDDERIVRYLEGSDTTE